MAGSRTWIRRPTRSWRAGSGRSCGDGALEEALGRLRVQIQQVASGRETRALATPQGAHAGSHHGRQARCRRCTVAESSNDLSPPGTTLTGLRFFRDSGTEIGLGYATAREPTVWMTNGASTAAIKTIAEIRSRYLEGWDFGTAAHPGVRIHIPNSRTEKILQASEVFTRLKDSRLDGLGSPY